MEKKQVKEYIQITLVAILIILFGISAVFAATISQGLKDILFKANIRANDDLVVHFIDVGQGDAIAIKFPNQKVMLIDSGPKISQNHLVEYMKNEVLASNNKLTIDYLLLTHPDGDHSGAMCAMFGQFDVIRFFRPNIACESENINNFAMQSNLDEYNEVVKSASNEKGLQVDIINQNYEFFLMNL